MTDDGGRRKEERNEGERDEHFVVPHVQHLVYRTLRSAVSSSTSPLLYFSCTTSSYLHNRIVVPSSIVAHIHRRPVERERDRRERTQCTSVTTFLAHNRKIKHELVLCLFFCLCDTSTRSHLHTSTQSLTPRRPARFGLCSSPPHPRRTAIATPGGCRFHSTLGSPGRPPNIRCGA